MLDHPATAADGLRDFAAMTIEPKVSTYFDVGEQVRVSDGPSGFFYGTVENVDDGGSRLTVALSIFGRVTPVDLEFGQVEKL
jgi:transcriptional antiterminator NusG